MPICSKIKYRQGVLAGTAGPELGFTGRVIHLVSLDEGDANRAAACGKRPQGKSHGWSAPEISWATHEDSFIVTCPRCRALLTDAKEMTNANV